jgi:hypothetical protein
MIRKILFARQKADTTSSAGCNGKNQGRWAGSRPPPEFEHQVSAVQLLNVLEFSRQFPELTLHLAAARKSDAHLDETAASDSSEQLPQFPLLIAPDPREIRASLFDQSNQKQAEEDEFALFAAGCLPPPPEMDCPVQKKNFFTKIFSGVSRLKKNKEKRLGTN